MADNKTLAQAKVGKNDEFYTQLSDIENECKHYKDQFKNKVILCNCDDPYESNFFKYFALNFNHLGLKKLIATCYDDSPIAYTQLSFLDSVPDKVVYNKNRKAYKIEITEVKDYNADGAVDLSDVKYLLQNDKNTLSLLKGNGDFRSEECIELLKNADIVVTNPPFSLFREYIFQLMEYNKKFLIIGSINSITYKEIFTLIKSGKIWVGYMFNVTLEFEMPSNYDGIERNGKKYGKVPAITWLTNLDTIKKHEELTLYKEYIPDDYPKYETFDAIDVSKVADIPIDYYGIMGVPKTFIEKYNPEQFDILGYEREDENIKVGIKTMPESFLQKYREQGGKGHYTKGMKMLCFYDKNGNAKIPFSRILIRRKR